MEASSICCLVLALQMVSLVSATSRPFAPNNGAGVHQAVTAGQGLQSLQALLDSNSDPQFGPGKKDIEIKEGMMNEAAAAADYAKGIAKIGSTPPSCEHKCHGCSPCEPIQVPTISKTDNHHFNVNYANYEPEGWQCKCGPSFYSP